MQPWGVMGENCFSSSQVTSGRLNGINGFNSRGRVWVWHRVRVSLVVRVLFEKLVSVRIKVRVRVSIWNQGTGATKVMSRDCSLASDLVKAPKCKNYCFCCSSEIINLTGIELKFAHLFIETLVWKNNSKIWELLHFISKIFKLTTSKIKTF